MTATHSARSRTSRPFSTAEPPTRRARILVRGSTLLRTGIAVAALVVLSAIARGQSPGAGAALTLAIVVVLGITVRDRWYVIRIARSELDAALEWSCRMVLVVPEITREAMRVRLAESELTLRILPRAVHAFELRFDGPWRAHRKATLLRAVIAKQFEPALPRIRIRLPPVR